MDISGGNDQTPPMDKKGRRELTIPAGDDKKRSTCVDCGHIDYANPKPIVGAVVTYQDKILLCRRAIPPRKGFWTIPAGHLEGGETIEDGTIRETLEEACAKIKLDGLLAVYSLPITSQIHLLFRAELEDGKYDVGPESLEVKLFDWKDIPWNDLAFPVTHEVLKYYHATKDQKIVVPQQKRIFPIPGGPNPTI